MEKEFESSKSYKSELNGTTEFGLDLKPGLGKDKRGVSGVEKTKLINIGKKILKSKNLTSTKPKKNIRFENDSY